MAWGNKLLVLSPAAQTSARPRSFNRDSIHPRATEEGAILA